jgi:hypothetical protein
LFISKDLVAFLFRALTARVIPSQEGRRGGHRISSFDKGDLNPKFCKSQDKWSYFDLTGTAVSRPNRCCVQVPVAPEPFGQRRL